MASKTQNRPKTLDHIGSKDAVKARHREAHPDSTLENILEFEFDGRTWVADGDKVTGKDFEHLEHGNIIPTIRSFLGPVQWEIAREYPVRKLQELYEAWGNAGKTAKN